MANDQNSLSQIKDTKDLNEYKLDQLQTSLNNLNTTVSGLGTQLLQLQLSLPDRYLTRLEFAEILRQKEIQQDALNDRLSKVEDKNDQQDKALFELQTTQQNRAASFVGTIIVATISLLIGIGSIVTTIFTAKGH